MSDLYSLISKLVGMGNPSAYKFLDNIGLKTVNTPYVGKGYAETWPKGETGDPNYLLRPGNIPINKNGVQVFQPDKWTESDTAGEGLHIDPVVKDYRAKLLNSLTDKQMQEAKSNFRDYSDFPGMNESRKVNNLMDALMRGYTVGQAPKEFNNKFYSKDQKNMLNSLMHYMYYGNNFLEGK